LKKEREFQLDINLGNLQSNINHRPTIIFDPERDELGNPTDSGYYTLIIELNCPVTAFEKIGDSWNKIMSPLQLNNDLLNYWNLK
jgi:hypothetical protein